MSGDSDNVALWADADVLIGPIGATEPTDVTSPWDSDWKFVGLLNGEDGFVEDVNEDSADFYAWGGILMKTSHSKHKRIISFTAYEDNDVTFALRNPGSERSESGGLTTSLISSNRYTDFAIGFELREGDTVKRKWAVKANLAEPVSGVKQSESDIEQFTAKVAIYPDGDGLLYTELKGSDPAGS